MITDGKEISNRLAELTFLCAKYHHNVELHFSDGTGTIGPLFFLSDNVYSLNGIMFTGDDVYQIEEHSIWMV